MAENRQYEVTMNNNDTPVVVYENWGNSREGNGNLDYTDIIKSNSDKIHLVPNKINDTYYIRYGADIKNLPADATDFSLDIDVDGNTTQKSITVSNDAVGTNPAVTLTKKGSTGYSNVFSATVPQKITLTSDVVNFEIDTELVDSLNLNDSEISYTGGSGRVKWNGSNISESGANYGTYSYVEDGQTETGTLDGSGTLETLLHKACDIYDGTGASCVEIALSAVTTPTLVSTYANGLLVGKKYTKTLNDDGGKFEYYGSLAYEVCDNYSDYNENNLTHIQIGSSADNVTVDFTGAASATTKYLFIVNHNFLDNCTITKDSDTIVNEVVGVIKITYTP